MTTETKTLTFDFCFSWCLNLILEEIEMRKTSLRRLGERNARNFEACTGSFLVSA